jgi:hypothetical protein
VGKQDNLFALSLMAAVLPFLTFNTSYLIAALLEHVPSCFTYFEGCTSVSSTGRQSPESWLFKTGVLILALVLAMHWHRAALFLRAKGLNSWGTNMQRGVAFLAVIALTIYAITLGVSGEFAGKLRRIGTHGFAFSSWLTQITFVIFYRPYRIAATRSLFRWLVAAVVGLILVGIASETAKSFGVPRRPANNIAAWNAFLMLSTFYAILARIWWHHRNAHSTTAGRAASPSE